MTCLTGLKLRTNPNCLASTLRVEALKVLPVGTDLQLVELNSCVNTQFSLEFGQKLCPGTYQVSLTDRSERTYLGVANYNNTKKFWNISVPYSQTFTLQDFVYKDSWTVSADYQIELVKDKNCWKAFVYLSARSTTKLSNSTYGEFDVIANINTLGSLTLKKSCC